MKPPSTSPQAASLYHTHHSRETEDLVFWQNLATEQGEPILELGCGTGRVLATLASNHRQVVGLDYDAGMLGASRRYLPPSVSGLIHLVQADVEAFPFAMQFRLIVMPCNLYSTLQPRLRQTVLEQVAIHLHDEGICAVSMPNPALMAQLPSWSYPEVEDVIPHPDDGEPVQVSSAWQRTEDGVTFSWHYDHLLPDGRVERTSFKTHHYFASLEMYLNEITAAGLNLEKLYGDFKSHPYDREAPYLIWCARRGAK